VLLALSLGGVLSCQSAASLQGLELLDEPTRVHITIPRGSLATASPSVVLHRRSVPTDGYTTTMARTAADCARCLPRVPAVVAVDAALRRHVDRDEILSHLWGRGSGRGREVVKQADERAESSGESVARVALTDDGLRVEPQAYIRGGGRVDLLVEGRVVVEIDGFAYHSDPGQFAADRRRDAALTAMGYHVLRFTWTDAVRRPAYLVAMVRQVLAASA
jgi:very-short-patch-repair endonuclease